MVLSAENNSLAGYRKDKLCHYGSSPALALCRASFALLGFQLKSTWKTLCYFQELFRLPGSLYATELCPWHCLRSKELPASTQLALGCFQQSHLTSAPDSAAPRIARASLGQGQLKSCLGACRTGT